MSTNTTSVRPHTLCVGCKSFWARVTCLNYTPEELVGGGGHIPSMPEHVFHSQHRSEVRLSASRGCHFCSIILGSVIGCTGDHGEPKPDDDGPVYIAIAVLDESEGTFLLTLFGCEQQDIVSHDQILNTYQLRLRPSKHVEPLPKTSDRVDTAIALDEPESSMWQTTTYSEEAARYITSWIRDCQTNHFFCGNSILNLLRGTDQPTAHPRRLLDLRAFQDPESIRLIDVEQKGDLEYCTLSYSWGFRERYLLTSTNILDFHSEIHVNELPKLFRDVIHVVRGIGYRYLWIDALCMLQDGHVSPMAWDEWNDEVLKMNDIFGNSVMTIAASEAFDGHSSLIKSRNPLAQTTCQLGIDLKLSYEVVPWCTPHCSLHGFDKARYHIDTRAWVFQERILSPRTVHITRNFIHLECRTELRCEAMSEINDCHHSGAVAKADYNNLFAMLGPTGLADFAVELFLGQWHELIRKYSNTNLSRPADLLLALAGLVQQIQFQSSLTWSFGLWREHFLRDMLWYVRGGTGIAYRERAPTWSWASIDVQGSQIIYEPSTNVVLVTELIALPDTSDLVRQPALTAEDELRYIVKLVGRLQRDQDGLLLKALGPGYDSQSHRNCQGILQIHPSCPFHPDYKLPDGMELFLLPIAFAHDTPRKNDSPGNWVTKLGIVLTPVKGHVRYQRVGYFHHNMQFESESEIDLYLASFGDNSQIQEIEIV